MGVAGGCSVRNVVFVRGGLVGVFRVILELLSSYWFGLRIRMGGGRGGSVWCVLCVGGLVVWEFDGFIFVIGFRLDCYSL